MTFNPPPEIVSGEIQIFSWPHDDGGLSWNLKNFEIRGRNFNDELIAEVLISAGDRDHYINAYVLDSRTIRAHPTDALDLSRVRPTRAAASLVDSGRRPLAGPRVIDITITEAPSSTDVDGDGHHANWAGGDDCDDFDPFRYIGNTEIPDPRHDEDCNPETIGGIEKWKPSSGDDDGDGWVSVAVCNIDQDGNENCGHDCDDAQPEVNPHQIESCNGRDDNCNGEVDEQLLNCPMPETQSAEGSSGQVGTQRSKLQPVANQ